MTAIAAPELRSQSAILNVNREDIRFWSPTPDDVRIEIVVHNRGTARSDPTLMLVQSAPLGVFLPWRPLTTVTVPEIDARSSVRLRIDAKRTPVAPLGAISRIPPANPLAAVGAENADDAWRSPGAIVGRLADRLKSRRTARTPSDPPGGLAPDIFEQLEHRNPHWAGNINVFVGQRSVERHMARPLRIYPARTNLAVFLVGTHPDAYSFELTGAPLAEYASLVDAMHTSSLVQAGEENEAIPVGQWLETLGPLFVTLVLRIPESCEGGSLEVLVRQRSTGNDARVEFSMDAHAAGPGCFTV